MTVHSRQFLLGPEPRQVRPDWLTRQLSNGLHLSHCPTLPVVATSHGLVLGDAIDTDSPEGDPDSWSGRWVCIDGDTLRVDTGGLLGCFLRVTDMGQWVSSSLEILRVLDPQVPPHQDRLERNWRVMDWYPPPHSALEGISRLLPSQVLDLSTGQTRRVDVPLPHAFADGDEATLIARVRARLTAAIRGASALAAQDGGRVWIGLTGGRDSRVVLAAAAEAGIEAMTYTFIRPQTVQGDRDLPPRLARAVGYEHVQIPMDVVDPARAAEFDEHTSGGFDGGPRLQYSSGGWDRVEASAVALEGGCFEMARCYYYDRLPREVGGSPGEAAKAILERFPTQRPDGVRAWTEWAFADGIDAVGGIDTGLDWRDRFYLEQRVGGWLSAGLQGFDISGRRQVHIANERNVLADLLSFPQSQRRSGAHEAALVEQMAPDLTAFPYNPDARSKGQGGGKTRGGSRPQGSRSGGSRSSGLLSRFRRG